MGSPSGQVSVGAVRSTNALLNVRTVGYRPRLVILHVDGDEAYWQEGMPDNSMYKRIAAGTGTLATTAAITPLSDGFSLGADADLNPSSADDIRWTCYP